MKVLNLIVKQEHFDQIMAGEKTKEYREVKPTTVKQLIELDEEGYEKEDEVGNAIPVKYDAIKFAVGYRKDRDTALVEVKGVYTEMFTDPVVDEDGDEIVLRAREGKPIFYAIDEDGEFLQDKEGNFIEVDEEFPSAPMQADEGEVGVVMERPITYQYEGRLWVAEQVVFELGAVLEKHVKEKPMTLCGGIVKEPIKVEDTAKTFYEVRCHEAGGSDYHYDYYLTREEAEAYIAKRDKEDPEACLYEHLYIREVKK